MRQSSVDKHKILIEQFPDKLTHLSSMYSQGIGIYIITFCLYFDVLILNLEAKFTYFIALWSVFKNNWWTSCLMSTRSEKQHDEKLKKAAIALQQEDLCQLRWPKQNIPFWKQCGWW